MTKVSDIVGSGFPFPLRVNARGGIELTHSDDEEIHEAIEIILSTAIGQRMMRPAFGSRLHELVFAPINAHTFETAKHHVYDALGYWEPRIDVTDVQVEPDKDRPEFLLITISYRLRATHDERALVFPFYTIPSEE